MAHGTWASHDKAIIALVPGLAYFLVGDGGTGYTLEDSDLWGLQNALEHGLQDGYFHDNEEWAKNMVKKISVLRFGQESVSLNVKEASNADSIGKAGPSTRRDTGVDTSSQG